jgi:hypothetical protein
MYDLSHTEEREMKFRLEMDTSDANAAEDPEHLVRNALLRVSGQIGAGGSAGIVRDANGVTVGSWTCELNEEVATDGEAN